MQTIINIIACLFDITPYISIPYFFIVFFNSIFMLFLLCVLIFDNIYRPNIPQYAYNFFLDIIIPFFFIINPSILIMFLTSISGLKKLKLIFIVYLFIILPITYCWSKQRHWEFFNHVQQKTFLEKAFPFFLCFLLPIITFSFIKFSFPILLIYYLINILILNGMRHKYSWSSANIRDLRFIGFSTHPELYFYGLLAILYPLIWGIYFSFIRMLKLGQMIDLNFFLNLIMETIFLAVFIYPFVKAWFVFIARLFMTFSEIRKYLITNTTYFFYLYHLKFLQNKWYQKYTENLFKITQIFFDIFVDQIGATHLPRQNKPLYFKITSFIYYNTYVLDIMIFSSILIELLLRNGYLYFSIYTLFFYPLIRIFIHLFNEFGTMTYTKDVCFSDYLYLNKKPRYPAFYYYCLKNPILWFDTQLQSNDHDSLISSNLVEQKVEQYRTSTKRSAKVFYRTCGLTQIEKNNTLEFKYIGQQKKWSTRLVAYYKKNYHVRWYHASTVLYAPYQTSSKIHPIAVFLSKNPYAHIAYLNMQGNFNFAQAAAAKNVKQWPTSQELYNFCEQKNLFLSSSNALVDVMENNHVMRYSFLAKKDVLIGVYNLMKERAHRVDLEAMQLRPDMLSYWKNQIAYMFKGFLGTDEKHRHTQIHGRNQAINNISHEEYRDLLQDYSNALRKKHPMTPEMELTLSQLQILDKQNNFDNYLNFWAENLHHFPKNWKPPLRLVKTFDDSHLTPKALELLKQGDVEIRKISDQLYTLNVNTNYQFTTKETFKKDYPDWADVSFVDGDLSQLYP